MTCVLLLWVSRANALDYPTSPIDGCALRFCSSQALKPHPGLRIPPVQSKIAPLISLTLHSQRRSSMVCFRVAHRDSQTHPGLRIHFTLVRLHPILSSDIRRTLSLRSQVQRSHQLLLRHLLLILRIRCLLHRGF